MASRTGETELQAAVFERAIELARRGGERRHAKALYDMLHQNFLFDDAEAYLDVVLRVFDTYLEITEPASLAWAFSPAELGQAGSARRGSRPVDRFPEPTPYLDADRLSVLSRVQRRLQAAGRIDLLVSHLKDQAAAHDGTTEMAFELAAVYSQWWFGAQNDAVERLSELCNTFPGDGTLWVISAKATLSLVGPAAALEVLNEAPDAASRGGAPLDRLRQELLAELSRSDVGEAARGLEAELSRRSGAPELGPFLRDASSLAMVGGPPGASDARLTLSNSSSGVVRRGAAAGAKATGGSWDLVELLEHAKNHQRLDELAASVERHVAARRDDLDLALLDAVVQIQAEGSAVEMIRRWAALVERRGEEGVSPSANLVIEQALDYRPTRAVAFQIGGQLFALAEKAEAVSIGHGLAVSITRARLADGEVDKARAWVDRLPGLVSEDPTLADEDGILRSERLADLAVRAPGELAAVIVRSMIADATSRMRTWQDPRDPIRPLVRAVSGLGAELGAEDRVTLWKEMAGLIETRLSASGSLEASKDSPWLALGRATIALATGAEQLAELTSRWERAPYADMAGMETLRYELAVAAGEMRTALEILDAGIRERPRETRHLIQRAAIHCELRDWEAADADLTTALVVARNVPQLWCQLGRTQLAAGEADKYRKTCRQMLEIFGQRAMREPELAEEIAWCCALGSGLEESFEKVESLARVAGAAKPARWSAAATVALVKYRQADYRGAYEAVTEAIDLAGVRPPARLALLAVLVHRSLGQLDEALRWYDRAADSADKAGTTIASSTSAFASTGRRWWPERWEANWLRAEAAHRLGLPAPPVGD